MDPTRGLVITRAEPELALDVMAAMRAAGSGWINLTPEIADDVRVPATPGALAVFSKRGPAVPLATWTAAAPLGRRPEPAQVGLQHGVGAKVVDRLRDVSVAVPDGWVVVQDHPRRGLVLVPPPDAPDPVVLDWLARAVDVLCRVPSTGRFLVYVYQPADR